MNKIYKVGMPLVIALAVVLGMMVQKSITANLSPRQSKLAKPGNKIDAILNYIDREYVDTINLDQVVEDIVPSILKKLDPHSVYIPASELQAMNEPLEGNFDGIGVQFNIQKDTVVVIKVITGGPSEKVGLRDGDRIVTVNDSLIAGKDINNDQVLKLLRGQKGTKVTVGIARRGEKKLVPFTITRAEIPLYSVDVSYMLNANTGYIKLSKFAKNTHKEFQEHVAKLKGLGMTNLIFDLRGNSGGYMDAAVNIADEFLENGRLIVYTQGRARPRTSYNASHRTSCGTIGLTILIDEWSASASEIVAGAIQDNDRGTIVGRRSFGKGLVQEPVMFADGSGMRLTIARYYTPAGRSIQKPYQNGKDDEYYADLINRFYNGEFMYQDSIHPTDTIKYFTRSGRVVYGGGGIMPDVFVPYDTTGNSDYFDQVSRKGLEYQFAFEYTDNNRNLLSAQGTPAQLASYLGQQNLLGQFVQFAQKNGVKPVTADLKISGHIIETHVKALIARNVFDNDGFYPIMLSLDNTLKKALDLTQNK
jgi:carboxyl-terminal processing protease